MSASIFQPRQFDDKRPIGITVIALLLLLYAMFFGLFAVLIACGVVAMSRGAWIVGGGLEILGWGIFAISAIVHFLCAMGLRLRQRWALRIASLVLLYGLVQVTPAISSAVADGRLIAIAREGLQIIWRVVALWYLWQEPTRNAFERKSEASSRD